MKPNKVILNGETLIDLTADTVTPDKLAVGVTAHDKSGNQIVGTLIAGGGGAVTLFTPSISLQSVTSVLTITDDNGGFAQGYNLYANDNLITVLTSKTATLTDYIEHTETLNIKVQAVGTNFNSSEFSNVAEWAYVNVNGTPGLAYSVSGTDVACTGIGTAVATNIEIASEYNGLPVKYIDPRAFNENQTITSVVIPYSVSLVKDLAFRKCINLILVDMSDGVTQLRTSAFYGCVSLKNIFIPKTVTRIDTGAFGGCTSLKRVDMSNHESIPTLGSTDVFSSTHTDLQIKVPASLIDEWKNASNWSDLASKIVTEFTNEV